MTTSTTEPDLVNSPAKQVVANFLTRFSDEATLAEIAEEINILVGLREGLIASREGRTISHEEFMRELRS
jgi:hypothetical protein